MGLKGPKPTQASTDKPAEKRTLRAPLLETSPTEAAHTPAPWHEDDGAIYGVRPNGDMVRIADTFNTGDDIPEEEAEANAKILVAAPDAYAVCRELICGGGTAESLQRAIDLARVTLGLDERI